MSLRRKRSCMWADDVWATESWAWMAKKKQTHRWSQLAPPLLSAVMRALYTKVEIYEEKQIEWCSGDNALFTAFL